MAGRRLTDALGQVTTIAYELATDPLKMTKITDPFGRCATFTYTAAAGRLASISDGMSTRPVRLGSYANYTAGIP